jgi:hypothetical protein
VLLAGISYPALTAGFMLGDSPGLQSVVMGASGLASVLGQTGIAIFNWRVFRAGESAPAVLAVAVAAGMTALWLAQALGSGWGAFARTQQGPWALQQWCSIVTMGWGGLESILYYAKLRKRLVLGLADPVVANRFLLWGVFGLMATGINFTSALGNALGIDPSRAPLVLVPLGFLGAIACAAMYLAFFPPAWYLAHLRGAKA